MFIALFAAIAPAADDNGTASALATVSVAAKCSVRTMNNINL